MIRYNYYLTTFKEVFNDVIEERKHILKEEVTNGANSQQQLIPQSQTRVRMSSDLRHH